MTLASVRKALAPAVLAIAAVIGDWIASGSLDESALRLGLAGLFTAAVVWAIPNDPTTSAGISSLPR